ncbi:MAG: Long-chain-fatty-acid--CoA ligase FadD13 [Syntrophorhabdus sp. PtaU1.Bin153]|nr:MAG: Long-chain-fatty-acid--CoA ligase FadD13 [Syntrophorhabdus sp. PtaU1.Bin153]
MKKGDRFAVLAYNCVEWMEIYAAAAKGGFICVPLMFRLAPVEMEYNINHSECKVFIVQGGVDGADGKEFPWIKQVTEMKKNLPTVEKYISFAIDNPHYDGFVSYEDALAKASPEEPATVVTDADPWVIMYTGGTTGKPKGVVKTHASLFAQYFIMIFDHQFNFDDTKAPARRDTKLGILKMFPNSQLYEAYGSTEAGIVTVLKPHEQMTKLGSIGREVVGSDVIRLYDEEGNLITNAEHKVTFTSLVPTHYIMMLALPDEVKAKYDVTGVKKLLCSSLLVMPCCHVNSLFYSFVATWVGGTVMAYNMVSFNPEDLIKTLPNVVGELYSRSPMLFEEYWKDPEKTAAAMKGEYFSAGDMAFIDEDGYYTLVDRKANMIISGGENVFPSEVENCVGGHPKVKDVAVIGVPHEKWGEQVTAVIVLHEGQTATPEEISSYCKGKIAGFKVPKNIIFIKDEEMPRSGAGKILHRMLREQYGKWSDHV